ncbi:MAG: NTP transferase domain-containing protein [Verrucomicrobiia bacterium]
MAVHLGAIILGAGASSRMGKPKLLLPWGPTSVVGHLIKLWRTVGANQVTIVCATGDEAMQRELSRLGVPKNARITNPQPERGMFTSIQCAARWEGWAPELTHWAVVLGDQPHVPASTLRSLLAYAAANPDRVCQPSRHGRPRHPVILPRQAFVLLAGSEARDLREFLKTQAELVALCEIDDAALDLDLDYPADYERAVKEFGGGIPTCGRDHLGN